MSAAVRRLSCETPIGPLTVTEVSGAISSVEWGRHSPTPTALLCEAVRQLRSYFDGVSSDFDLPLAPAGSAFQRSVWRTMRDIPYGATATYGEVARRVGSAARAIGLACSRNPIPIIIPCHRVVGAGGKLTGYSGGEGLRTKAFLLALEAPDRRPAFR